MEDAAPLPCSSEPSDPSHYFPAEREQPRLGPEYQAAVPDAVDPEVAAGARRQGRINAQIIAPSLSADGPAAGEALAALIEEVSASSRFCV